MRITYRSNRQTNCRQAIHCRSRSRDRRSGPSQPVLRHRRDRLPGRRRCCPKKRDRAGTGLVDRPWTRPAKRANRRHRCCVRCLIRCLLSWTWTCRDGAGAWCRLPMRPSVRVRSSPTSYRWCCLLHGRPPQLLARPATAAEGSHLDRTLYRWASPS